LNPGQVRSLVFILNELSRLHCLYINHIQILPVLYGCESWSLGPTEENSLIVFENRMLGRKFGPNWEEVAGSWRRLHNEELRNLYFSPNNVRVIK
jgi:hypothetical protein